MSPANQLYLVYWLLVCLSYGCHSVKSPLPSPNPPPPVSEPLPSSEALKSKLPATQLISLQPAPALQEIQAIDQAIALGNWQTAQSLLAAMPADQPVKPLLQARCLRLAGKWQEIGQQLPTWLADNPNSKLALTPEQQLLYPLWLQEMSYLAWANGNQSQALALLQQLIALEQPLPTALYHMLLTAWSQLQPASFLQQGPTLQQLQPAQDMDGDSLRLAALAQAAEASQEPNQALQFSLQRYLETPLSSLTPTTWPAEQLKLTAEQRLQRIERLVEGNRNQRALLELQQLTAEVFDKGGQCRFWFANGLTLRKERKYAAAEQALSQVVQQCQQQDPERTRRAHYLLAKVASISRGLAGLPVLEQFISTYGNHAMVDDVLFWAGDLHQSKGTWEQANRFYELVEQQQPPGDHCSEARWRRAWVAMQNKQYATCQQILQQIVIDRACTPAAADQARARYWQGRVAELLQQMEQAIAAYEQVHQVQPMGFYAQLTTARQQALGLASPAMPTTVAKEQTIALELGWLNEQATDWQLANQLLALGLGSDAVPYLLRLLPKAQASMGQAHQVSLGLGGNTAANSSPDPQTSSEPNATWWQPTALLAWALDQAGAYQHAHMLVRSNLEPVLQQQPSAAALWLWRLAYPLAYRHDLAAAEQEQGLPSFFLQALAREESAFDPQIVSWAEAYGLTQLLYSSGQEAGGYLRPKVPLASPEALLEPGLNARLGGALVAHQINHLGDHPSLGLIAYNAGYSVATGYRKRFACQALDQMVEQISIQETRGYVKRVLRTFGMYRWLYGQANGALPVAMYLPAASNQGQCAVAVSQGASSSKPAATP